MPPLLVLSCLLFLGLGWWTSGRTPAHHEEISTFPTRPARVLVANDGALEVEPSCADPNPPVTVSSEGRPELAVCTGGLSLPVLIAPYASGIPHWHSLLGWPLHAGTVFGLRRWGLLVGLLSLLLIHRLVRRLKDELTADVTTLVLCVSPAFILLHATLLQYEVAPWVFLMLAGLAVLGPEGSEQGSGEGSAGPRRPLLTGLLTGLAMTSNVKAAFLLVAIVFVAWRVKALRGIPMANVGKAAVGFVLGLAPLWGPNLMLGGGGLSQQIFKRTEFLARPTTLEDLGLELVNVVRFGTDTGSYMTAQWEPLGGLGIATAVLFALAMLYVLVQTVRVLGSWGGHPLEALTGCLVIGFVLVSLELYNQRPAANYAPLHGSFAIMVAMAVTAAARWLQTRGVPGGKSPRRTALALASIHALGLAHSTYGRISTADDVPLSINAQAERRLVAHLIEHPEPTATIYTTTYNLAGVIDSLGRGELSTVRLERVFNSCNDGDTQCVETRFGWLIDHPGALPARVVLPASATRTDEHDAMAYESALARAAERAGVTFTVEEDFAVGVDGDGPTAIRLVRLHRSRPHAP
ncbi:hypothetical protein [Paraliomyxa miuraensis]|uniref:hypothetical protein n=1 Tax=Paraliomyxa miuraensis TaxID=376150 RepID=UPI00224E6148|nr:hypothetical protein [Paraliomyxa miuraensis]MCX4243650.1 hypothetical protein [Paraliomyxa miuraensis]